MTNLMHGNSINKDIAWYEYIVKQEDQIIEIFSDNPVQQAKAIAMRDKYMKKVRLLKAAKKVKLADRYPFLDNAGFYEIFSGDEK